MFTTPPRVIAFDGDDTLWRNEDVFTLTQARYRAILAAHVDLSKIARSGLEPFFERIEIVSEKDQSAYRRILHRAGVDPAEFAMVGNTMRSDVLPVLALGGQAFHVPYHTTWAHEAADAPEGHAGFAALESIGELPGALWG